MDFVCCKSYHKIVLEKNINNFHNMLLIYTYSIKSINVRWKPNVLHTHSTNHKWLASFMQASKKGRRENEKHKVESKKQITSFLCPKWICALTKIDKSDASVNRNVVMLIVLGMPRNNMPESFEIRIPLFATPEKLF